MTRLSVTQLCTLHFVDSGRKTRDRRSSWRFHTSLKVCGCGREGVLVMRMKYPCLYADADGESHFKDVEIEFQETDFAPPAPPVSVSSFRRATQCGFLSDPAGWYGDSHPTPQRQFFFILRGQAEVRVSDGEVRAFGPGTHSSWRTQPARAMSPGLSVRPLS